MVREAEKAKEEARIAREQTEQDAREKAKMPPQEMFKKDVHETSRGFQRK